ncbi:DUF433 domain-containing protein [Nocardia inohanensis]|uniref:DUF433 domain-containing protein n=1 Tax=Nocardia inohanensis TaxID=209246 RepID=UPI00082CC3DB|nr:DUF433 domain-containing protein [Nocardia inohanensis]
MAFPVDLTCTLTGATRHQLSAWRTGASPLLVPEVAIKPKALYSFRDVLALRTMVFLRSQLPLQRIRKAFRQLVEFDLTEHPSRYKLVSDGQSVFLIDDSGQATDLVLHPGQKVIAELSEVFAEFRNFNDTPVVDFLHPRKLLEVREGRMSGWPTIVGTRIPYDTIAGLQRGDHRIDPSDVRRFYPAVSPEAAVDARSFDEQVRSA